MQTETKLLKSWGGLRYKMDVALTASGAANSAVFQPLSKVSTVDGVVPFFEAVRPVIRIQHLPGSYMVSSGFVASVSQERANRIRLAFVIFHLLPGDFAVCKPILLKQALQPG